MALTKLNNRSLNAVTVMPAANGSALTNLTAGFTQGTLQSPTSGTTVDFTGIPNNVKVVYLTIDSLARSSYDWLIVQLGDSGGFETSGYTSAVDYPGSGNAFYANTAMDDNGHKIFYQATAHSGLVQLMRVGTDQTKWIMTSRCHAVGGSVSYSTYSACTKTLSAALTQLRITSKAGSVTFSSGSINILYSQ